MTLREYTDGDFHILLDGVRNHPNDGGHNTSSLQHMYHMLRDKGVDPSSKAADRAMCRIMEGAVQYTVHDRNGKFMAGPLKMMDVHPFLRSVAPALLDKAGSVGEDMDVYRAFSRRLFTVETVKPPYLVLLPQIDMGQASCLTAVQFVSRADAFDHAAEVAVELLMKGLQPKDPTEAGAWADARSALKATVLDELNLSG